MPKANEKKAVIELEDTDGIRIALDELADRSVYDRISSLFYIAVFSRLVDYGETPTDAHVEEAIAIAIAPDDFVRLSESRSNVDANPQPAHQDYGLDTRQVLSENQYQATIQNSERFMKAVQIETALTGAGFEPTTTSAEVMESVTEQFVRRQKFRSQQEEFAHAKNKAMMGEAKSAFMDKLSGLK